MEDSGLLPGLMKLVGEGGSLKKLVMFGEEKSSISSFRMIPVDGDMMPDPNLNRNSYERHAFTPGFLPFGKLHFIHASTNATDDNKYSPLPSQILTVLKFWYHLAHTFYRGKCPF